MENNNQNLDLDSFEVKCINDYVHFLLSFYHTLLTPEQYLELKDILYEYIEKGNFAITLSNNSTNLRNFFNTNGNTKFKKIPMLQEFHKKEKSPKRFASVLSITPKSSGHKRLALSLNSNNSLSSPFGNLKLNTVNENEERTSSFAEKMAKRKTQKYSVSVDVHSNLEKLSPPPTKLLRVLPSFNRKQNFVSIKTSGQQSNMMVSSNGHEFFKASLLNGPKKRQMENECRVYLHLEQVNPIFLRDSTCFLGCYSDGILLRNGGLSLMQLLKEPQKVVFPNLLGNLQQQFFPKLLELHCSGVSHNDLHCENIVGFDKNDIRFIDFGLAKSCQSGVNIDFLTRLNRVFEKIFFAFARKYRLF